MTILCQRLYFLVSEELSLEAYNKIKSNPEKILQNIIYKRLGYQVSVSNVNYEKNVISFSLYVCDTNISYCTYVLDGKLELEKELESYVKSGNC